MGRFESDLCTYLNAHSEGEFKSSDKIAERWATDKSIGHISLLLATLAAGAHYSDIEYPQRLELATDFGMDQNGVAYYQVTCLCCNSSSLLSRSPIG